MRRILLPGVVVLGAMTSDGLAEPVRLTDVQMDAVTSGQLDRLVARVVATVPSRVWWELGVA